MRLILIIALLYPCLGLSQAPPDQTPFECAFCEQWNQQAEPYQLAENAWYVGPRGLSSVLIADSGKLALIDGALPQSVDRILTNIRRFGFDPQNIEWIMNSHPHYDHAGGIAALARITGARVVAGEKAVVALEEGPYHPDDPQLGYGESARFPSVTDVTGIGNGESIKLGNLVITAVATPGHTPGGMSWTWQACDKDSACKNVVYLDSLSAVSADGYRFTDHPETTNNLRESIGRIENLPCDIAIAAHPNFMPETKEGETACAAYARVARNGLEKRLASEAEN